MESWIRPGHHARRERGRADERRGGGHKVRLMLRILYAGKRGGNEWTNLVFLQHLFLLQRLHRVDSASIHLLYHANLTKRALADDFDGPEVAQPHLRPLQPQEGSLLLAQPDQLPLFSLVGHHRVTRKLSFDLHAPENIA